MDEGTAFGVFPWSAHAEGGAEVWYFGDSYETLVRLRRHVPNPIAFAPLGRLVNETAERYVDDMINLDAQLFPGRRSRLWDASDLAERNPVGTSFFRDCCRAMALLEATAQGKTVLAVCSDEELMNALVRLLRKAGHQVTFDRAYAGGRRFLRRLAALPRHLYAVAQVRFRELRTFVHERRYCAGLRGTADPFAGLRDIDVLVVTWAGLDTFPKGEPVATSPFYGPLPHILREMPARVGYLACPLRWIHSFEAIARNVVEAHEPAVLLHECVHPLTVVKTALTSLIFPFLVRKRLHLGGHDLSPLVRLELRRELRRWRQTLALSHERIARTLEEHGVRPKRIVYLHENQPWEKLFRAGLRQFLVDARVIGVHHPPTAEKYISVFPSRRDIAQDNLPDILATIGDKYREAFITRGVPPERVCVGGALRYTSFIDKRNAAKRGSANSDVTVPRHPARSVLVCGDIEFSSTFEFVHKSVEATAGLPDFRLLVNFHPVVSNEFRERLRRLVAELSSTPTDHVTYVEGGAGELIPSVAAIIHFNSATAFEALDAGIPAICVGLEGNIDLDTLPTEVTFRCHSIEDIRAAVESALAGTAPQVRDRARIDNLLDSIFAPVRADVWRDVLGSEASGVRGTSTWV